MIDVRTLLSLLAVADLVLAATLWIGASRRLKDGLSHWAASLVVRALAFGLFGWSTHPQGGALALAAALLALSMTLQAAALVAFNRRPLAAWVHTAVIAGVAVPMQLLVQEGAGPTILFGGVVFGTLLAVIAAMAWQVHSPLGARARPILVISYSVAAAAFVLRGIGATFVAEPLRSFNEPFGFAAVTMIGVFGAAIASTLAFLLMHKDRAEAEAARLATMDPLTGAYNRRTFHEIAEREIARARRAGQPLSMIMMDIDHFRAVNEQHGHRVGDEVLQRFADLVRSALRKEDLLVRFGGEEFLVLLPEVPGPGAVVVAGRIRRAIASEPVQVAGLTLPLTVSLGVAARMDEGPESLEQLLDRADSALALAKERGRNRVVALSLGRSIAA
jgi:diguanylate cyclase (GGDEF)-like protein